MKSYNGKKVGNRDYSKPMKELVLEVMGDRGMMSSTIARKIGRDPSRVSCLMYKMHQKGLVHISRWNKRKCGPITACYKLGAGVDAEKPAPFTNAEKSARYRATEKGKIAKQRGNRVKKINRDRVVIAKKVLASIDPLMAAIYG